MQYDLSDLLAGFFQDALLCVAATEGEFLKSFLFTSALNPKQGMLTMGNFFTRLKTKIACSLITNYN